MRKVINTQRELLKRPGVRRLLAVVASFLAAASAQCYPVLGLTASETIIESAFVSVDYTVDAGIGTLTARGFAEALFHPGQVIPPFTPRRNIENADFFTSFDLSASINNNDQTATGSLVISGEAPLDGFSSGTLLTGTLSAFGAGADDPLEFLFDITGGDAADLFGSSAGVVLALSGFSGDLLRDFSTRFTTIADTFQVPAVATVPEPSVLTLLLLGCLLLVGARHRTGVSLKPCRTRA